MSQNNYDNLFKKLGIHPKNIQIYETALTHSSYNFDANTTHLDYERLEFIGDSLIGFVVADLCFAVRPNIPQGVMTKIRSTLVQATSLKKLAIKYELEKYIRIGNSLKNKDITQMPHILEDVFEAIIGAVYIDLGLKTAYNITEKIFFDEVKNFDQESFHDYKSQLQEEVQSENRKSVIYECIDEQGPPHDKTFTCIVKFEDIVLGTGLGKTKKDAEQLAAKDALSKKA